MTFLLAFLLLFSTAVLINATFRHKSRPAYLVSLLIVAFANLVLIGEIASLLHQIDPGFFLLAHTVIFILAWLIWLSRGKPPLLGPFANGKWKIWRELPPFKSRPTLYILAVGVILVYFLGAVVILAVPQNTYDSMTYHLSRVGYWMQNQTLAPWPTPNPRQTTSPVNAEIGLLWTILFWGSDRLTGFVQWSAALGIMVTIFGLARLMGATKSQGLFAALIWATFPQIVLQSVTTQNDLVISFFFLSALYFLYSGLRIRERWSFMISTLALGLAIGTKATIFIILPGFLIALLLIWGFTGRRGFSQLVFWGAMGTLGAILLGVFTYVQNWIFYRDFFSIPQWTSFVTNTGPQVSRFYRGLGNAMLYFYQFFDFTGLPNSALTALTDLKAGITERLINLLGIPFQFSKAFSLQKMLHTGGLIQEDTAWFGPLSWLLLLPATIFQFFKGISRRDYLRAGLPIVGVGFYMTACALLGWTPYRGRYFVLSVSVLAPLISFIYPLAKKRGLLHWIIPLSAIWIAAWSFSMNISRPLIGLNAVWGKDRMEIRMSNNPKMKLVLSFVDQHVPLDAILATRLGVDHWDYVLFGPNFERKVIQLDPEYPGINKDELYQSGADYLLIAPRERPFLHIPEFLAWIGEVDGWTLYEVTEKTDSRVTPEVEEYLLGATDRENLLTVNKTLVGTIGVTELYTVDWDIESDGQASFKWLGEGLNQGIRGYLWSEKEMPVRLVFQLQPGPGREDSARNLEALFFWYGAYSAITDFTLIRDFQIDGPDTFEMVVPLQHGLNEFRLFGRDQATICPLPNGDSRPLLVLLQHIDVLPLENSPKLVNIDKEIDDTTLVKEFFLAPWFPESNEEGYYYWLGEGAEQGYQGIIWSEENKSVRLQIRMKPGPGREDPIRHVRISFSRYGSYLEDYQIDEYLELNDFIDFEIEAQMHRGLNQLEIIALDEATIDVQPNGDSRPLMVQLVGIKISLNDE